MCLPCYRMHSAAGSTDADVCELEYAAYGAYAGFVIAKIHFVLTNPP